LKSRKVRLGLIWVLSTFITVAFTIGCSQNKQNNTIDLFRFDNNVKSRSYNFENPTGTKGNGGKENKKAKGHAYEVFKNGEKKVLMDYQGCGIINRIWFTIPDQSPQILNSLTIEMYWDNSSTPAVKCPIGDFFCNPMGRTSSFENFFFSSPEKRSFNCYVQMPFRKAAKIVVTNKSGQAFPIFYDINFVNTPPYDASVMYFHACWNQDTATTLEKDFTILPTVYGKGRYLGAHIGLITNPIYGKCWWGEGEVKMYLDGDSQYPTIIGTGSEDYPGSGYALGIFNHRYQGCLLADYEKGTYGFYRYHVLDPVYFSDNCKVTMQQIGGASTQEVQKLIDKGVPLKLVSFQDDGLVKPFQRLLDMPSPPDIKSFKDGWVNFYRSDNWCAVAFYYLDKP